MTQNSTLVYQDMPCPKALGLLHQRGLLMTYLMTSDTIQNLSKVFKRQAKSYKIESSKETTSFLCSHQDLHGLFLSSIAPPNGLALEEPPTSKSFRKSNMLNVCSHRGNWLENSFVHCTYANKSDYCSSYKKAGKKNCTNILSRVYRCVSQTHW